VRPRPHGVCPPGFEVDRNILIELGERPFEAPPIRWADWGRRGSTGYLAHDGCPTNAAHYLCVPNEDLASAAVPISTCHDLGLGNGTCVSKCANSPGEVVLQFMPRGTALAIGVHSSPTNAPSSEKVASLAFGCASNLIS
jgi:hypothetical protein